MASLWPEDFDSEGNKTDWRYFVTSEYFSPSTGDFMYVAPSGPPIEDQMKWVDEHKDAIHATISDEIRATFTKR